MTALAKQKEPEPELQEDLAALHPAELAKQLYELTRGSSQAMAIYQELSSRLALEDMKRSMNRSKWDEVKKQGPEQTRTNAERMRDDWRRTITRLLLVGYMTRKQLTDTLLEYSKGRYRGKCGDVKESTIRDWLTAAMELSIRQEVDRLRALGVTAATYQG